jgi:hypothetical protein
LQLCVQAAPADRGYCSSWYCIFTLHAASTHKAALRAALRVCLHRTTHVYSYTRGDGRYGVAQHVVLVRTSLIILSTRSLHSFSHRFVMRSAACCCNDALMIQAATHMIIAASVKHALLLKLCWHNALMLAVAEQCCVLLSAWCVQLLAACCCIAMYCV